MKKPNLTISTHQKFDLKGFGEVDPFPTLEKVSVVLDYLRVKWYLSAGLALGIHRDNRFIPHDTDLDIAIELPWQDDYAQLTQDVVRAFAHENMILVRSLIWDQVPVQLVFADMLNDGILVDVEFYFTGITEGYVVCYKPEGHISIPVHGVKQRDFKGLLVPMPYPIEDYLEARYGEWRVPTKEKGDWQSYTKALTPWTNP